MSLTNGIDKCINERPDPFSATSSAALPVSFASNTPAVCKVSGTTLTLLTAGGCSVTASQSGTTSYTAAVPVTRELMVGATSQTITFNPVAAQSYAGTATTVALTATSSVGLPVSFTSGTDSVCTVTGSTVTLLSAGTCTLTAVQAGDSSYDAAAPVVQSFTVTGTAISIAVTSPVMSQTLQSPVTMTLTAAVSDNSGNTITNVAFYNGTSLMGTVTQFPYSIAIPNATAGSYSITAQATDSKGLTATSALVTVTVAAGSGAEQLYYISTDQLNTPRVVTNSDGVNVWQWDGEAFGNTPPNSNPSNLGTFTFNMRFPGQYFDAETGLNQNYHRDYDPNTGRYIESDPLGLHAGQASTFAYAGGQPNKYSDPLGLVVSSISVNGDNVSIDLRINYQFHGLPIDPNLANTWNNAIQSMWTGDFGHWHVKVNVSSGCGCPRTNNVNVVTGMPNEDRDWSYFNGLSIWGTDSSYGQVGHEAGHLMGLNWIGHEADFYYPDGTPWATYEHNIMANANFGLPSEQNITDIVNNNIGRFVNGSLTCN